VLLDHRLPLCEENWFKRPPQTPVVEHRTRRFLEPHRRSGRCTGGGSSEQRQNQAPVVVKARWFLAGARDSTVVRASPSTEHYKAQSTVRTPPSRLAFSLLHVSASLLGRGWLEHWIWSLRWWRRHIGCGHHRVRSVKRVARHLSFIPIRTIRIRLWHIWWEALIDDRVGEHCSSLIKSRPMILDPTFMHAYWFAGLEI
jgi:hypothetical protein